jgi:lipoate-protein ligase A
MVNWLILERQISDIHNGVKSIDDRLKELEVSGKKIDYNKLAKAIVKELKKQEA